MAVNQDYRAAGFALGIKNRMGMCSQPGEIDGCDHLEMGGSATREPFSALEGCPAKEQLRMEDGEG